MASPRIRARIAAIALLIALAFVIVGFFRADREMTHAERDQATLVVSQTAALVEVFLSREFTQLRSVERAIDESLTSVTRSGDTLTLLPTRAFEARGPFDDLWIVDSTWHPYVATTYADTHTSLLFQSQASRSLPNPLRHEAIAIADVESRRPRILFVQPIRQVKGIALVAALVTDSLTRFLQRQHRPDAFGILVKMRSDTIVALSTLTPNKSLSSVQQSVNTPFSNDWSVVVTYAPSSRGARIALWVVGLGAIVGLGIGLLLERREANRIADRSSELEHLSAELLRANRAKSEFLANVSHELRTPLNAIVGFVDLLRDGVYGPLNSRQAGPVERIEASANHLRHLVDQVLDLAKMAAGRLEVHTEPIELRPFVFDVASEVEPLMTEKGLSLSLAVGATLPRVRTDPTHLRQILINLLGNAVKYTTNGGISVRGRLVKRNDDANTAGTPAGNPRLSVPSLPKPETLWVALQVADSGIGIPEKDRERIFDEFEQVNAGPRGDSMRRGTGLGLSISRRLARLLGGDITVESELERGSVFTVWLPADPADLRGDQVA